jgi:RNA polymerase sigma factor (sigma-70 family)
MSRPIADAFFRHEYGRLVALLSRRVGLAQIAAIEDAAQFALLRALEVWQTGEVPVDPSAWLYRVAHNHLVDELRQRGRRDGLLERDQQRVDTSIQHSSASEFDDRRDQLLMLVACCDEVLPLESQLVLALKTLAGFDVREISERLFMTEANVYKRLSRARARLCEVTIDLGRTTRTQIATRAEGVRLALYMLFSEGYLSHAANPAIRRELCDEAKRLTLLLMAHEACETPETFALLALMTLHMSRLSAREDASGGLLLLEEQDRSRWNQGEIREGLAWLARAAEGDAFSRYHAEAGIAAEHCLAPTFAETRWERVVECYLLLESTAPSPLHTLNRAVAVAEWKGAAEGLAVITGLAPPSWLSGSHLWSAVLADLHRRCGNRELSDHYRDAALAAAPSLAVRAALSRRLTP